MSTVLLEDKVDQILKAVKDKTVYSVSPAQMALLTSGTMQRLQRIDADLHEISTKLDDALGALGDIKTRLGMFEPPMEGR